jgi:hypothetical protein
LNAIKKPFIRNQQTMTPEEERYAHLLSCSSDLNDSWSVFQDIKEHRGNPLVGAAFRYALIAYARSFSKSRGTHSTRYQLDECFIPIAHRELHHRLINARHQIHAHSDLTVRDIGVHVAKFPTGKWVGVVQRTIRGTEELENLDEIISLVEGTLQSLYEEVQKQEAALPLNWKM